MKKRLIKWIIYLAIGFGIGALIGYYQAQNENGGVIQLSPEDAGSATVLRQPTQVENTSKTAQAPAVGGDFTLVNQNGETVTQNNFSDEYKLIFFGFTYCPAVCPTELQKVSVVMDELGDDADKITPIFISIDPERDTPEVMKDYVAQFNPKLVGLTGTQDQIDDVKEAYKVYATKVENEMMDEYMMDHSAFLYFMSPDNTLVAMYPSKDTAEAIANDIKTKI